MNHNSGGCSYIYSSTSGCVFQRKGYNIKLFIMDLRIWDIKEKFRLGTKKVSLFVLVNYSQNEDSILEIRNIEIISEISQNLFKIEYILLVL